MEFSEIAGLELSSAVSLLFLVMSYKIYRHRCQSDVSTESGCGCCKKFDIKFHGDNPGGRNPPDLESATLA